MRVGPRDRDDVGEAIGWRGAAHGRSERRRVHPDAVDEGDAGARKLYYGRRRKATGASDDPVLSGSTTSVVQPEPEPESVDLSPAELHELFGDDPEPEPNQEAEAKPVRPFDVEPVGTTEWAELLPRYGLHDGAVITLLNVALNANYANGSSAYVGVPTLTRRTGRSERTVRRHLREGERYGVIVGQRRPGATTVYRLTRPVGVEPEDVADVLAQAEAVPTGA